jgi:hypothetical protein
VELSIKVLDQNDPVYILRKRIQSTKKAKTIIKNIEAKVNN